MIVARLPGPLEPMSNAVVTVGTFDGIHRAHQEIIQEVVRRAKARRGRSVVVTFHPHPKEVVESPKGRIRLLTTLDERLSVLANIGIELTVVIEFTREFSRTTPREFYEQVVVGRIGCSEVVVGFDHMFGRNREAGTGALEAMGKELGFVVHTVQPVLIGGKPVSSTRIRRALEAGACDDATEMLGRRYDLSGRVVRGDGRGKTIGFPTANLHLPSEQKLIPAHGVYAVGVELGDDRYYGVMNIGVRPTVDTQNRETLEVHILEFDRDCYGEDLTVKFLHRLREERKFGSITELTAQIRRDRDIAAEYVSHLNSNH